MQKQKIAVIFHIFLAAIIHQQLSSWLKAKPNGHCFRMHCKFLSAYYKLLISYAMETWKKTTGHHTFFLLINP